MSTPAHSRVMRGAEPFFFEGGDVGCIVSQGFTGTPDSVRFLGEYLAREGNLTVIGPRLTGHGTTPNDLARASAQDWIRDVEAAAEHLHERCTKLFMAGLSMGGTLTLYLAGAYPQRLDGIVPINAALFSNNPELAALTFAADAPESVDGIASDIKRDGVEELAYPVVPVASLRHLFALLGVTRELLPRITCPALVITSREDHVVPPENGPYILERIGSSQKRIEWLEDSYHVATMDNDRERIGRATLAFIRSHC